LKANHVRPRLVGVGGNIPRSLERGPIEAECMITLVALMRHISALT